VNLPTTISRRDWISALTLLPAARALFGQQNPGAALEGAPPKFSSEVNVVNLFATVRDKQGKIVKNLTKDDFVLDEEGKPQTIRYFTRESDLPLFLGLLVDTSGSQRNVLGDEHIASYRFFDQILREDRDLAFVLHFDFDVELLQDFTASRKYLENALDKLGASPRLQQRQGQGGGGRRRGGGTNLYDAVLLASDELMAKQKGRKALVLLTDGVDTGSMTPLFDAIKSAQKADTMVYSILFSDPRSYSSGLRIGGRGGRGRGPAAGGYNPAEGKLVLEQIARETGGRFLQVSKSRPIDKIYADIEEELRSQYSIGYTPDQPSHGIYRHVHLATRQKNMTVVTREGYYAG